ncbi:hypothetical protein F9U64_12240 [Gracilibacillus oryzae]|uniref:Competence protein n=1 Tax=Gracilibacillus oryzae TaxID=1672701 RepID=A0A7C8KS14_9BACI|nr:competence protein ComK [Gracilibacillus oryzae]KAB8133664.1 hypothetical protein F9U64_12240 [Gracilibacillus oryzae]
MYRITKKTLAITPYYDLHFQSKVVETEKEVLSTDAPLQIIQENCLHYGASYEGRKQSVRHHLPFFQKTPIPIHPAHNIYCFPTKSPRSYDCYWLFYAHIYKINAGDYDSSVIHFTNGLQLILAESFHSLQNQYDRTSICKVVFQSLE